jgi:pyruvate/2-oxoglutarate dehydrogenase complex dihydrolipoamide dehydrogenase (E3) component
MKTLENTSSIPSPHKSTPEDYDPAILGGGTGSTIAAWTFTGQGQRVAVVERKYIGGSCPNIACLPSKNIIHSAKVASYVRRRTEFGITPEPFTIDMAAVLNRKRSMVSSLNNVYLDDYRNTGTEFMLGFYTFGQERRPQKGETHDPY